MNTTVDNMGFTAEDARKLAGLSVKEKVGLILVAIKEAATNKRRQLRTGYDYKPDRDLWILGGYKKTKDWNEACQILSDLGFQVEFYYAEHQLVDMYTIITW